MDINMVPLLNAAKGITWQGAAVIIALAAAYVALGWLRLVNANRERAFWLSATPEQIMARAASAHTVPAPTKPPPSPIAPLAALAFLASCMLLQPGDMSASRSYQSEMPTALVGDFACDTRRSGLPIYSPVRP